ncbi:MAG TPA: MFS transporter, partial [Ktedonobacterales bacterium]|nr:MFS transporter [Ktedonobacterales bacterium]
MLSLLSQRNFLLLWLAHTVSILGDYVFFIAMTFWVYARTGSSVATSAILIASGGPIALLAPLAGKAVDRWSRRHIMLVAEGTRATLFLALLAFLVIWPANLWPLYVVGFAQSVCAAFFWPARSATLPQLVPAPSLLPANALYQLSDGVVRVCAPTLASAVLLFLGAPGVTAFDALTFLVSAGCIAMLTTLTLYPTGISSAEERTPTTMENT